MLFFGAFATVFMIFSMLLGIPVIDEYVKTGLVPRFPSLIVAGIFLIISLLLWSCGMILKVIIKKHKQLYELLLNQQLK